MGLHGIAHLWPEQGQAASLCAANMSLDESGEPITSGHDAPRRKNRRLLLTRAGFGTKGSGWAALPGQIEIRSDSRLTAGASAAGTGGRAIGAAGRNPGTPPTTP
jgi:hypothetical protein